MNGVATRLWKNLQRAKHWRSHTSNTEEHLDAELVRQPASIADDRCDDPKITLSIRCVSCVSRIRSSPINALQSVFACCSYLLFDLSTERQARREQELDRSTFAPIRSLLRLPRNGGQAVGPAWSWYRIRTCYSQSFNLMLYLMS